MELLKPDEAERRPDSARGNMNVSCPHCTAGAQSVLAHSHGACISPTYRRYAPPRT